MAQINAEREWGPANIFNKKYINGLKHQITLSKNEENLLRKIYSPLSFYCLDSKYQTINDLLSDIKNPTALNKILLYFKSKQLTLSENDMLYNLLEKEKTVYQSFWEQNQKNYLKRLEIIKNTENNLIQNYLMFLDELKIGKNMPDKICIYLIDSLGNRGRGLRYGCAIGLPNNESEAQNYLIMALHEMTHTYTDHLLSTYGYPIAVKPTDSVNHMRKEHVVNYLLQLYLNKYQIFHKNHNLDADSSLVPNEIKKDPRLAMLHN